MCEKQVLQEFELTDSIISRSSCLLTFKSTNTDSNMRCSNHVDIISSISNRECGGSRMLILDERHYLSLLLW
jgi:hypothetical protein